MLWHRNQGTSLMPQWYQDSLACVARKLDARRVQEVCVVQLVITLASLSWKKTMGATRSLQHTAVLHLATLPFR